MAITPPRSGVQLLNPASLIGGQQRNTGGNLDQFINFALQQKLQQSSQQFQGEQRDIDRNLDMEQFILGAQASGQLVREDDARIASLPGEANFTRVNVGNDTFVLGREVEQATSLVARAQPVSGQGGREFFEDTTQGDISGSSTGTGITGGPLGGTGSQAASRIDDFTVADKGDIISELNATLGSLQGRPEFEGLARSIEQHIQTVEMDERFSLTEANRLRDQFGADKITGYVDSVSGLQQADRDVASRVGSDEIDFRSKHEINTFDESGNITGRRPLNLYESHLLAKRKNDIPMSDLEMSDYEAIPWLLNRQEPIDKYQDMVGWIADGATDDATRAMLTSFTMGKIAPNGQLNREHPLAIRILNSVGAADEMNVNRWLKSPASADYRASYAMSMTAGPTVSDVMRYQRNGGDSPVAFDAAINVEGSFIHEDIPYTSLGRGVQTRGEAVSGEDDIQIEGDALEFLQNAPPPLVGVLDRAIRSGDYSTMRSEIQRQAEAALAASTDTSLDENAREVALRWSQDLDGFAAMDSTQLAQMSRYISIYNGRNR